MNVTITGLEKADGELKARINSLKGSGLRQLHFEMITEVQHVTYLHLWSLAAWRHSSSEKLGADPSGYLSEAAVKVARSVVTATSTEGVLTINHPGMSRAFHDVKISKPGGMIAIPLCALAYQRSPRQIWDSNFFILRRGRRCVIFKKQPGGKPLAMYSLLRSVTQKQDRSLLPSNMEWQDAALLGANKYVLKLPSRS